MSTHVSANPQGMTRLEVGHPNYGIRLRGGTVVEERIFMALNGQEGADQELWITDGTTEGTYLVRDVNPDGRGTHEIVPWGAGVLFSATSPEYGSRELWISDGTEEGTQLLVDINPDGDGDARALTRAGCLVYFTADDGKHGQELWVSDGTEEGTSMVADIALGQEGSDIEFMRAAGSVVYFRADDGEHGQELWTSDGTKEGTHLVADLTAGEADSLVWPFAGHDGEVLFKYGENIWYSDGSEPGTVEIAEGEEGLTMATRFKNKWVFIGWDEEHGAELWSSDGTPAGTQRLFDANPGPGSGVGLRSHGGSFAGDPANLMAVFGDHLYFQMFQGANGDNVGSLGSLGRTDGKTFELHAENRLGASRFVATNDHLLFAASSVEHGAELFSTNGTPGNAEIVQDITKGGSTTLFDGGPVPFGSKFLVAAGNTLGLPDSLLVGELASACNCSQYDECVDGRCVARATCIEAGGNGNGDGNGNGADGSGVDGAGAGAGLGGAGSDGQGDTGAGCQCRTQGGESQRSLSAWLVTLSLASVVFWRRRNGAPF